MNNHINRKPDEWARQGARNEYHVGYRLGKSDARLYGEQRSHDGEDETLEGYEAGYILTTQRQTYRELWQRANDEYGTQHPTTMKVYHLFTRAGAELEKMDWEVGEYGPL